MSDIIPLFFVLILLFLEAEFFLGVKLFLVNFLSVVAFSRLVVSDSLWPYDYNLPGSSVHEISQARILEWVAIFFSRDLPYPVVYIYMRACQVASVMSDSLWPPGSSVHGILQARVLEWGAIAFSEKWKREAWKGEAESCPCEPPGKPGKPVSKTQIGKARLMFNLNQSFP